MARATFVKAARKDVPGTDIKAGQSYYWWKFKRDGKRFSKTPPKRSQLTQSAFYSAIYDLEDDMIGKLVADESLTGAVEDIVNTLTEIRDQCQESLDNMPEGLQQGSTGELLQERIDAMESAISEFEQLDIGEFDASTGSAVLDDQKYAEGQHEGECKGCGEADNHTAECEHNVEGEMTNDDGQTADEYWQAKLEEAQAIGIEAP